jgi:hypothetical protein
LSTSSGSPRQLGAHRHHFWLDCLVAASCSSGSPANDPEVCCCFSFGLTLWLRFARYPANLVVGLLVGWWFYALSAVICNSPFNNFRFVVSSGCLASTRSLSQICPGGIPVAGGGLSYAPPLCLFQGMPAPALPTHRSGFMYELGYLAFLVAWYCHHLPLLFLIISRSLISVHSALAVLLKRTDVFNRRTMILSCLHEVCRCC